MHKVFTLRNGQPTVGRTARRTLDFKILLCISRKCYQNTKINGTWATKSMPMQREHGKTNSRQPTPAYLHSGVRKGTPTQGTVHNNENASLSVATFFFCLFVNAKSTARLSIHTRTTYYHYYWLSITVFTEKKTRLNADNELTDCGIPQNKVGIGLVAALRMSTCRHNHAQPTSVALI